jgi:hypothetical protein
MTKDNGIEKTMLPLDPSARVLHFLSVPRGVQSLIGIEGSSELVYIVNPTDGRKPFIVIRETEDDPGITHLFKKSEANNDNL